VAWWHESLQRAGMESVRQGSLQGKAFLGGDAFLDYTCKANHCLRARLPSLQSRSTMPGNTSSCLRAIVPLCHVASLNVSIYAPVLVTSNDRQCKSCSK